MRIYFQFVKKFKFYHLFQLIKCLDSPYFSCIKNFSYISLKTRFLSFHLKKTFFDFPVVCLVHSFILIFRFDFLYFSILCFFQFAFVFFSLLLFFQFAFVFFLQSYTSFNLTFPSKYIVKIVIPIIIFVSLITMLLKNT